MASNCTVCTDGCDGEVDISALQSHFFRRDCSETWTATQQTCPHCRRGFISNQLVSKVYLDPHPASPSFDFDDTLPPSNDEKIRSLEEDLQSKDVQLKEQANNHQSFIVALHAKLKKESETELRARVDEIKKFQERLVLQDHLNKTHLQQKDLLFKRLEEQSTAHERTALSLLAKLEDVEAELKEKDARILKLQERLDLQEFQINAFLEKRERDMMILREDADRASGLRQELKAKEDEITRLQEHLALPDFQLNLLNMNNGNLTARDVQFLSPQKDLNMNSPKGCYLRSGLRLYY